MNKLKNIQPVIGILAQSEFHKELYNHCAIVSKFYDCEVFYFSNSNIDSSNDLIKGKTFQNGRWIWKDYSLSNGIDVIFDRLRTASSPKYKHVYDKIKHIPTTHPNYGQKMNKLTFYDKFYEEGTLLENIIPYERFLSTKATLNFLEKHRNIILKPQSSSGGKNLYYIYFNDKNIEVALEKSIISYSSEEFSKWLDNLSGRDNYVLQKFIPSKTLDNHPFDIRVHMIRNINNEWEFLAIVPRVGHDIAKISMLSNGGYIGQWKGFVSRNFSKENYKKINRNIREISLKSVEVMEKVFDSKITEVGIDFVINKDNSIYFVEYNVNKPAEFYAGFDLALNGIGYARYIALNATEEDYIL